MSGCWPIFVRAPTYHDGIKLRVSIDRRPSPYVASTFRRGLGPREVLLLRIHEGPNLIDLDAPARQVLENPVLIPRGSLAGLD